MYDVKLNLSHFPAQSDAEVLNITVGDLLREVAAARPEAEALVEVRQDGSGGRRWTYTELLKDAERLAWLCPPGLRPANGWSSGHPTVQNGSYWNMPVRYPV